MDEQTLVQHGFAGDSDWPALAAERGRSATAWTQGHGVVVGQGHFFMNFEDQALLEAPTGAENEEPEIFRLTTTANTPSRMTYNDPVHITFQTPIDLNPPPSSMLLQWNRQNRRYRIIISAGPGGVTLTNGAQVLINYTVYQH